jgi:hypothetical protein
LVGELRVRDRGPAGALFRISLDGEIGSRRPSAVERHVGERRLLPREGLARLGVSSRRAL